MPNAKFWLLLVLLSVHENVGLRHGVRRDDSWKGKWFPSKPKFLSEEVAKPATDRVPMGVSNPNCDNAKTNLTVDWDGFFEDYTCSNPRNRFVPNEKIESLLEFENIPKMYRAAHFCMDREITYSHNIPSFGPHRPLWPIYGEYKFVPKQRWLHSLEHGGIVALYHPCADLRQISLLKKLVKSCLRRHIISPSRDLSEERPFALLAWGVRLTMPKIYANAVRQFIKERALKGPEEIADDGQFDSYLIEPAAKVSDFEDSKLCPDA